MEVLGVQCVACGTKRRHKSLRYHPETYEAYCENPYVCNDNHPNSPANLIKRQRQLQLVTFDEAESAYRAGVVVDKADRLKRLMTNPLTVRITSVEMAQFLIQHSDITEQTISELVRGFIESMMVRYATFDKPQEAPKQVKVVTNTVDNDDLVF